MPALLTMTSSRPNSFTAVVDESLQFGDLADFGFDADGLVALWPSILLLKLVGGLRDVTRSR